MSMLVLALVCAASMLVACDAGPATPVAPSILDLRASPAPPAQSGYWSLTTTLTAISGPDVCFDQRAALGLSTNWWLDVRRESSRVLLVRDVRQPPANQIELAGMADGSTFEAHTTGHGQHPCGGVPRAYELEARVTGEFSPDGRALDASERVTYRLESGQAVVLLYAWHAERT